MQQAYYQQKSKEMPFSELRSSSLPSSDFASHELHDGFVLDGEYADERIY